jgi:hypothetical protein
MPPTGPRQRLAAGSVNKDRERHHNECQLDQIKSHCRRSFRPRGSGYNAVDRGHRDGGFVLLMMIMRSPTRQIEELASANWRFDPSLMRTVTSMPELSPAISRIEDTTPHSGQLFWMLTVPTVGACSKFASKVDTADTAVAVSIQINMAMPPATASRMSHAL